MAKEINATAQVIATKVVGVRIRTNDETGEIRYRLMFADTFAGKVYNHTTHEYESADINYLDLPPFVVVAQIIQHIPNFDVFYTKKKESKNGFGAAELGYVLRDADVTLVRNKFLVGEEYTTNDGKVAVHDHEGYSSAITKVIVTKAIAERLQRFVDDTIFGL